MDATPAPANTINSAPNVVDSRSAVNWDRIFFLLFILGIASLGMIAGLLMGVFKTRAYGLTEDAVAACQALVSQREMAQEEYLPWLWQPAADYANVLADQTNSDSFYCLYASGGDGQATIVDAAGNVVHQWQLPYSKAFPTSTFEKSLIPDHQVNLRRAHVFPNGDLLALYETPTNTPAGMGICRVDRAGNLIWSTPENCHHDFAIADDGTIFTLTHTLKTPDFPQSYFRGQVCLEDFVTVLDADGNVSKSFSLLQAYYESSWYRPDILKRDHTGDLLHTNTINLVTPEFAAHYDQIEPGFLMVCFRNINLVAVVDPDSQEIVWAISGPWHFPHDPDPLDNGNVMIFDNCYDRGTFTGSRVVEFDPRTCEIVWQTTGPEDQPMRSDIRSTQQLLPDGNVLICDSNGGRMLQVDRQQRLHWQFLNPTRIEHQSQTLTPVMTAVRWYDAKAMLFLESPDPTSTMTVATQ